MPEIAIVGCGIIGMTTAIALQKRFPTVKLTIFTKETTPNTTSDIAAGLWEPFIVGNTPEEKITRWSASTYNQLLKWWKEGKAKEYGVCLQPALVFTAEPEYKHPMWLKQTLGYQKLPQSVLDEMSKKYDIKFTDGFNFIAFTWEPLVVLPHLQKEFTENDGKIIMREIKTLNELSAFDVVINCTGLQSRNLIGDSAIEPVRGQIEKVEAPWQFHSILLDSSDKLAYIIPNTYLCTIGGTKIKTYDTSVNEIQRENIRRNCLQVVPSLNSAKSVRTLVGLRPGRTEVRLELETIEGQKGPTKIIHNYGHGGAGVTLSLGCADEVVDLVSVALSKHKL